MSELEAANKELTERKYKGDSTVRELKAKLAGVEEVLGAGCCCWVAWLSIGYCAAGWVLFPALHRAFDTAVIISLTAKNTGISNVVTARIQDRTETDWAFSLGLEYSEEQPSDSFSSF